MGDTAGTDPNESAPMLGLASTRMLLDELRARMDVRCVGLGGTVAERILRDDVVHALSVLSVDALDYRTVDALDYRTVGE